MKRGIVRHAIRMASPPSPPSYGVGGAPSLAAAAPPPAAWTPASLANLAAWYDPSDLATMWQDSGKTTPVTASGQYVGYIEDKSANGYHLSQATAGARPQLLTSGTGQLYLNLAGAQFLTIGANSMFNNRAAFCAGAAIQSTGPGMIHAIQHAAGGDACEFSYSNNGTGYELSGRRLATDGFSTDAIGTANTSLINIIANHDYTAATIAMYIDGVLVLGPSASQTAGSTPAVNGNGNAMGGWPGGGYNVTANLYQLVLAWGVAAGELADFNTFLTSKR